MKINDVLFKPIILRPIKDNQMGEALIVIFEYITTRSLSINDDGNESVSASTHAKFLNIDTTIESGKPVFDIGPIESTEDLIDSVSLIDNSDSTVVGKVMECYELLGNEIGRVKEYVGHLHKVMVCLNQSLAEARELASASMEIRDQNLLVGRINFTGNINVADLFFNKFKPEMDEVLSERQAAEPTEEEIGKLRDELTEAFKKVAISEIGEEKAGKIEVIWNVEFLRFQLRRSHSQWLADEMNDDNDEIDDKGEPV